jgi:23S rRNA U2552 (ribose-2'-O)-methylase RlmE/FtsJ
MKEYNKPDHFLDLYRKLFDEFKDKKGKILELGIQKGGSLELWENWLPKFQVIGVDIRDCKEFDNERIKTLQLDQRDEKILEYAPFDIIIDDGGHKMSEQIDSFRMLYPSLNSGGLYIIEDLNSSYWDEFWDQELKTVDFLRGLVDDVNKDAYNMTPRCHLDKKEFYDVNSISFYKYLCVIRK